MEVHVFADLEQNHCFRDDDGEHDAVDGYGDDGDDDDGDDGAGGVAPAKATRKRRASDPLQFALYDTAYAVGGSDATWVAEKLAELVRWDNIGKHCKLHWMAWKQTQDMTVWKAIVCCPFARRRHGLSCPWRVRVEVHDEKRGRDLKHVGEWRIVESDLKLVNHSAANKQVRASDAS